MRRDDPEEGCMNEEMSASDCARAEARAKSLPATEAALANPDEQARRDAAARIEAMYRSMEEFLAAHVVTQEHLEMKISI